MVRYYEDHTAYFYGKISAVAGAMVTHFMTGHFIFIVAAIGMLVIMFADIDCIRRYKNLASMESAEFKTWEKHYTFLSISFMMLLGIWSFFCFTLTSDSFIHMLCLAISLGNVLGVICRHFSNERLLTYQLFGMAIPLVVGILHYGDYRAMILGGFFLPLFASVRDISARLRNLFANVEKQTIAKQAYSTQLDAALESMSHGIVMFDSDMRVKIINARAREILGIDQDTECENKTLGEISQSAELQVTTENKVHILSWELAERLKSRSKGRVFRLSKNQFVDITLDMRDEGGCVMVIEEVSDRIRYQNQITQLARFDELTGLYNRSYFLQRARMALENRKETETAAVLFFDLDDFKRINDKLGHETGDFTLVSVAERLRRILPESTFAGRYGGDEFAVFVDTNENQVSIENLVKEIVVEIPKGISRNNKDMKFGISLGYSRFPDDGKSIDRLLKLADLALYKSKATGKNIYTHFSLELEQNLHRRIVLEEEISDAVRNKDFKLHFQPIICMDTGETQVFEALCRWERKGYGNVSPDEFIPITEDLGLVHEIGEWILLEACRQCCKWPENTNVAINLSAMQFQIGSIVDSVKNTLKTTGLDPTRLELEITETAVLSDMSHAAQVMKELNKLGVRISLDDFGTGYSSLSYLHKLPLDKLKIDKAFIDDLDESERSRTLLKGIVALGKALDLKIVVEGVETKSQFELLRNEYNIDYVQGFYFSKPIPADSAVEYAQRAPNSIIMTTKKAA